MKTSGLLNSAAQSGMDDEDMERRATEALRSLLGQVSVIKVKEISRTPEGSMLARVEVLGHSHTLACEIKANAQPGNLRTALQALHDDIAHRHGTATPVLIAQHFSAEAQALCQELSAGYLDLEGNARLALGEVFIGTRSLRARSQHGSGRAAAPAVLRGFPPARIAAPAAGRGAVA